MFDNAKEPTESKATVEETKVQPLLDEDANHAVGGISHAQTSRKCGVCHKSFDSEQTFHDHMVMAHGWK